MAEDSSVFIIGSRASGKFFSHGKIMWPSFCSYVRDSWLCSLNINPLNTSTDTHTWNYSIVMWHHSLSVLLRGVPFFLPFFFFMCSHAHGPKCSTLLFSFQMKRTALLGRVQKVSSVSQQMILKIILNICWQAQALNINPGKLPEILFRDDSLKIQLT